jgi:PAS domain S-box-containing protein
MDKGGSSRILLDLLDPAERRLLEEAMGEIGIAILPPDAPTEAAGLVRGVVRGAATGSALDAALREAKVDVVLVAADSWLALRDELPRPPRPYIIVLLLDPDEEGEVEELLKGGVFDYLVRREAAWHSLAAGYLRALAALRLRYSGAFSALERRYEDLVNSLPDIVYELDDQSRFTFVNDSVRLLGYVPADLVGKHFSVLLHEEDAAVVDRDTVLKLMRGRQTGQALSPKLFNERRGVDRRTENLEVRLKRKPGSESSEDLIVTVTSYGEVTAAGEYTSRDGDFMGSVGVIRDITLRRKSEEMLRKLYQAVDQLTAGILVADSSFKIEYVNPTFFRLSNFPPQEVIGAELFSFFDFTEARAEELKIIVSEGFDVRDEAPIRAQNEEDPAAIAGAPSAEPRQPRSRPWMAIHVSPVRSPSGTVSHAILVCEDISQRRAMEELVRLAKDEAERANRAKSDFLATMSHELKSPVASVLAAARLIEMGGAEPERRARSIIGSAQGLLNLLGDILDFVRFETGSGLVRKYVFPLPGFVARFAEPHRAAAEAKDVSFEIGSAPHETVRSDPDKLGRAFSALVANAVAFTDRGRVRIDAGIEKRSGNVPHLVLSVSDTGRGIAVEDQERIFEPFVQLASPFTKNGGAGIGLSLARNIVRALGGEIRLESEPGRGSTFTILVPAGEPEAGPQAEGARRSYRILVVDDNEVNLEYMATILGNSGHRTDVASSGAEALAGLSERAPDAVVLDIQMPGMSGIELGAKVRAYVGDRYDPSIPLIALTAFDPEEVLRSGVDFDAVFSKPVDVPGLLSKIDEAVDRSEAANPSAFVERRAGRAAEADRAFAKAEGEVPGLLGELRAAASAGDGETARQAARALAPHFTQLGADRMASALRRLVLCLPFEDKSVVLCRIDRLSAAWEGLKEGILAES